MPTTPSDTPKYETGTGVVKWFNREQAFGFITFDDREPHDIFVHIAAINNAGFEALEKGQRLAFRIQKRHRDQKPFATHLRLID